jgi:hypothetical protein
MIGMGSVATLKAANDNVKLGEGYARLMRSLDGLLAALDRQSEAVADFRGNCETLEVSVDKCSQGLRSYQEKLDRIDTGGLRRATETLSRSADGWLSALGEDERDGRTED